MRRRVYRFKGGLLASCTRARRRLHPRRAPTAIPASLIRRPDGDRRAVAGGPAAVLVFDGSARSALRSSVLARCGFRVNEALSTSSTSTSVTRSAGRTPTERATRCSMPTTHHVAERLPGRQREVVRWQIDGTFRRGWTGAQSTSPIRAPGSDRSTRSMLGYGFLVASPWQLGA